MEILKLLTRRRIRRYLEALGRPTVVVHTNAGASIRGILTGVYDDVIVLRHAAHLSAAGTVDIDGEAIILRHEVQFLQHLAGELT